MVKPAQIRIRSDDLLQTAILPLGTPVKINSLRPFLCSFLPGICGAIGQQAWGWQTYVASRVSQFHELRKFRCNCDLKTKDVLSKIVDIVRAAPMPRMLAVDALTPHHAHLIPPIFINIKSIDLDVRRNGLRQRAK